MRGLQCVYNTSCKAQKANGKQKLAQLTKRIKDIRGFKIRKRKKNCDWDWEVEEASLCNLSGATLNPSPSTWPSLHRTPHCQQRGVLSKGFRQTSSLDGNLTCHLIGEVTSHITNFFTFFFRVPILSTSFFFTFMSSIIILLDILVTCRRWSEAKHVSGFFF